jgi:hypothetical protein
MGKKDRWSSHQSDIMSVVEEVPIRLEELPKVVVDVLQFMQTEPFFLAARPIEHTYHMTMLLSESLLTHCCMINFHGT